MDKVKVLWVSDLVTPTGFSTVSHSIIKYLGEEFDITGVGINYHGDPHDYKFPIFPAATTNGSIYGDSRVVDLLNSRDFDILFMLNDAWVINKYLLAIKKFVTKPLPKIVAYFPVDASDHDSEWYENFDIVDVPVVYTKFAEEVVLKANDKLKLRVIPHGVDTSVFYRLNDDRWDSKIRLFGERNKTIGTKETSFIVLNANRNQPRKKLDITMRGFAKFAKDKPESVKLYMHCGIVDASIHVGKLAIRYGIDSRLIVTSQKKGVQTVPVSRLNEIYNACDVGINTSMGEGWGLCNVEHAATGAAQLVPNHSACAELFGDCGMLMKTYDDTVFDGSLTTGKLVTSDEVADNLQTLYDNKDILQRLSELAMNKFTSPEYNWETISKLWRDVFMEVKNVNAPISNDN